MIVALLDTNVLWPSLLRDVLLSIAVEGAYRPVWSDVVLEELELHEANKLLARGTPPAIAAARSARLVAAMRTAFPDAEIDDWASSAAGELPDPDDEHVLAAAVRAGASLPVTHNTKDFPAAAVLDRVEVVSPGEFAQVVTRAAPALVRQAIAQVAARSGRHGPALTEDDVRHALRTRYGLDAALALLGPLDRR